MRHRLITLLTDYGRKGGFVGALHAVAYSIAPEAVVIDLDHEIPPQDVRLGALRLERMMRYTPAGVHVAVVDPGVGSARRGLAIETGGRVFVGPDNGLLVAAVRACGPLQRVTVLEEPSYWRSPRSPTFDGRDVFVPVAAHVAAGVILAKLGPEVDPDSLVSLPPPVADRQPDGSLRLEVLQVDGFGNVQLAGGAETLGARGGWRGSAVVLARCAAGELPAGPEVVAVCGTTFGDVGAGEAVLLIDGDNCLALSVNRGRADTLLGAGPGDLVALRPR